MPSVYIPALDEFGDMAQPLQKLLHHHRSYGRVRPIEGEPLTSRERTRVLQAHCSKKGKRHDFAVETREGMACIWCGIVRAERGEDAA